MWQGPPPRVCLPWHPFAPRAPVANRGRDGGCVGGQQCLPGCPAGHARHGHRKTPAKAVFTLGTVLKTASFHLLNKSTFIRRKLTFLSKITATAAMCPQARKPRCPTANPDPLVLAVGEGQPPRPQGTINILAHGIPAGDRPSTGSPSPSNPAGLGSIVPAETWLIRAGFGGQHAP